MQITEKMAQVLLNSNSILQDPAFAQALFSIAANPNDPELVWYFKLEELIKNLDEIQSSELLEKLSQDADMKEMINQRYLGPKYKLETLKNNCPPGSLGDAYYHHMMENGIPAYDYSTYESPDDASYIKLRKMQTHDIWHVVTGYNTNTLGELALQGFYQGQGPTVYQTLLMIALVLYYTTIQTKDLSIALEALFEGWQRGREACPLWAIHWEEMWGRSLADIRQEYNILPLSNSQPSDCC